jgi:hypothetical protein
MFLSPLHPSINQSIIGSLKNIKLTKRTDFSIYHVTMATNNEKTLPWAESKAKEVLITKIMTGTVTEESYYMDVYNSNPEYQKYKKENFRTNLKNLIVPFERRRIEQFSIIMM